MIAESPPLNALNDQMIKKAFYKDNDKNFVIPSCLPMLNYGTELLFFFSFPLLRVISFSDLSPENISNKSRENSIYAFWAMQR